MASMTKKLYQGLLDTFSYGIGSTVVFGVRYVFADMQDLKRKSGLHEKLTRIHRDAVEGGFKNGELCTTLSVQDGMLFVLSVGAIKQLMYDVAKASGIPDWPRQVEEGQLALDVAIAKEKGRLTEHILSQVSRGVYEFDISMFGNTIESLVHFTARLPDRKKATLVYQSFNLTHEDIVSVNETYLIPRGYKISKLSFRGFIPGKKGILVTLGCERLGTGMNLGL